MSQRYNDILKLGNLSFYNKDGNMLYAQKDYTITWKLIPAKEVSKYFHEIPEGYFLGEVDENKNLINDTMISGIIKKGKIYCDKYTYLKLDFDKFAYMLDIYAADGNKVLITINVNNKSYSHLVDIKAVFDLINPSIEISEDKVVTGTCNNNPITDEYYLHLFYTNPLPLQYSYDTLTLTSLDTYFIYDLLTLNIENIGNVFPFIYYSLSYEQEKVSAGLIAADTLFLAPIEFNNDDRLYSLVFQPETNTELHIVKPIKESNNTYDIQYIPSLVNELFADPNITSKSEPIPLTIAFSSDDEGCYLNYIGMYIRQVDNPDNTFFMGIIAVKTEVEGEDERYRALLENFGIPDPIDYSTIFASEEYDEEGIDYKLVNEKSKELMLTYDLIFPYAGTYKALLNAVKFLGYNDIIFKEWYHIKDINFQERDIAIQRMDIKNRSYLADMLLQYGVSIEDFANYTKLNKLTLVYHLNEIKNKEELPTEVYKIIPITSEDLKQNIPSGFHLNHDESAFISDNPIQAYTNTYNQDDKGNDILQYTPVDITEPLYNYTNSEVITKLWSVCKWLDKHILGVNVYIQDITAEGIIIGRFKTRGYVTQHEMYDYERQASYSLKAIEKDIIHDYNNAHEVTTVLLTLNEYDNITFDDVNEDTFESYAKEILDIPDLYKEQLGISKLYISNTFEIPVNANKFSIITLVKPSSMLLDDCIIENNNIFYTKEPDNIILLNGISKIKYNNTYNLDKRKLTVTIKDGILHYEYNGMDNYNYGIINQIKPIINTDTGETTYKIIDKHSNVNISNNPIQILCDNTKSVFTPISDDIITIGNYIINEGNIKGYAELNNNFLSEYVKETDLGFTRDRIFFDIDINNGVIANDDTYIPLKLITPCIYQKFDVINCYYTGKIDTNTFFVDNPTLLDICNKLCIIQKVNKTWNLPVYFNGEYNTKIIAYDNHSNKFTKSQSNVFNVIPSYTGTKIINELDNSNNTFFYNDNAIGVDPDLPELTDLKFKPNNKFTFTLLIVNLLDMSGDYYKRLTNINTKLNIVSTELLSMTLPIVTDNSYLAFSPVIVDSKFTYNDKLIGDETNIKGLIVNIENDIQNRRSKITFTSDVLLSVDIGRAVKIYVHNHTSANINNVINDKFSAYHYLVLSEATYKIIDIIEKNKRNTPDNQIYNTIILNGNIPLVHNKILYNYLDNNDYLYYIDLPTRNEDVLYIVPILNSKPIISYYNDYIHMDIEYNNSLMNISDYIDNTYKVSLLSHNPLYDSLVQCSIDSFIEIVTSNKHDSTNVTNGDLYNLLYTYYDFPVTMYEGSYLMLSPIMNCYNMKVNPVYEDIGNINDISYCKISHYVEMVMDMRNADMPLINQYNRKILISETFNTILTEKLIHKGKHSFVIDMYDRFGNHYTNTKLELIYVD